MPGICAALPEEVTSPSTWSETAVDSPLSKSVNSMAPQPGTQRYGSAVRRDWSPRGECRCFPRGAADHASTKDPAPLPFAATTVPGAPGHVTVTFPGVAQSANGVPLRSTAWLTGMATSEGGNEESRLTQGWGGIKTAIGTPLAPNTLG